MGKKVYLTFETSLTDICEVNSSFDKGLLRVCYAGENRNKSYIAKEDLERCVKTLPYVPVVGNYIREEEDFGGHDVEFVTDSDGTVRMVNKTQPVGVVPADADIYFETFVDDDGNEKEYLYTTVLLWKRQEAYKKIKEDGIVSHSMEITVKDGESIDGIYHIYDFEFTALCLLGENTEPCFEDSALEVFTTSDFKAQFELMMNDFKESFSLATTSTEDKYSRNETLEKGGEEDLGDNKEVFVEEEATVVEPVEEFEEEELHEEPEAAPEEVVEEAEEENESEVEPEEPEEVEAEPSEEFALNRAIENALWEALSAKDRIVDGEYDWCRYFFVDFDHEAGEVYFEDSAEDWKLFGCNYSMDGDNVVIDFESKRRMKYTIVEFDEGESEDDSLGIFAKVEAECLNKAEAKYRETIDAVETEVEELRKFKADIETTANINAHNAIIADFDDLAEVEEFRALCDNMLDYSLDEFTEKCYALRGKNMSNPASANFSMKDNMPKFPVESNGVKPVNHEGAPYNGVVEKYLYA